MKITSRTSAFSEKTGQPKSSLLYWVAMAKDSMKRTHQVIWDRSLVANVGNW